ncbi:hypothetical protein BCR34DRAFT_440947, partial [Clohesyomyces aquaticus]
MRLGTRSCIECRRRKVRCIFQPGHDECQSCEAHDTPCRAQQPDRRPKEQKNPGFRSPAHFSKPTHLNVPANTPPDSDNGALEHFEYAPMINIFKDLLLVDTDETSQRNNTSPPRLDSRAQEAIQNLGRAIPNAATLHQIFSETQKYWLIWPPCYHDDGTTDFLKPGRAGDAVTFVTSSFSSLKPSLIAKAVLFLCLCIQQLPRQWHAQLLLPMEATSLVGFYMNAASTLLFVNSRIKVDMDAPESQMLMFKLCINMGKPLKAWTAVRHALESALLLGLHRINIRVNDREEKLWRMIWQAERALSLILGLPSAMSNTNPGIKNNPSGESVINKLTHGCSVLAGVVIERDQDLSMADYSVTVELDQEAERLRGLIPSSWLECLTNSTNSVHTNYYIQTAKLQYFLLVKHIHLPYMLKSSSEPKFLHSRLSTLSASRNLVQTYQQLRGDPRAESIICELMDFQAFSGAMMLILGLLSACDHLPRDYAQNAEDLVLVKACIHTLRRTDKLLTCSIARQGAQLLEYLTAALEGSGDVPERFESVIPFFGKVKINREAVRRAQGHGNGGDFALDDF